MAVLEKYELEILQCLVESGVLFAVIGGAAIALHGSNRDRGDLDVLIRDTLENKELLLDAIAHKHRLKGDNRAAFLKEGGMWRQPKQGGFRGFDFAVNVPGMNATQVLPDAVAVDVGGFSIPVASVTDLIRNKQSMGLDAAPIDLADLTALKTIYEG